MPLNKYAYPKWLPVCLLLFGLLLAPTHGLADNVGIINGRLIEAAPGQYILEAQVGSALVSTIRRPIVPQRFELQKKPDVVKQGRAFRVRYPFSGEGQNLEPDDVLILPWAPTGVMLTVQWRDGRSHSALFVRGPIGVEVPVKLLRKQDHAPLAITTRYLHAGWQHFLHMPAHWLLPLSLAFFASGALVLRAVLLFAAGQAMALPLVDLGWQPAIPHFIPEVLICLLALLLTRSALKTDTRGPRLAPSLLVLGLLHALAGAAALPAPIVAGGQQLSAIFAAAVALDVAQLVLAAGLLLILPVIGHHVRTPIGIAIGSLALAIGLATTVSGFTASQNSQVDAANQLTMAKYQFLKGPGSQGRSTANAPRKLTNPVMSFVTIEPFEVRHEILLGLDALQSWTGDGTVRQGTVPVEAQGEVKRIALALLAEKMPLFLDGKKVAPVFARADFLSLGATGAIIRQAPEPERVDSAILGVVYAYESAGLPDTLALTADVFSAVVAKLPLSLTDPSGSRQQDLTAAEASLSWQNQSIDFRLPEVRAVTVTQPALPLLSCLLIIGALLVGLFMRPKQRQARRMIITALLGAYLLYPYARTEASLPFIDHWAPSPAKASQTLEFLLTNVYRSFAFRDESAIYDRLAVSVSGDHLEKIYLQQRRGLELENRGGARARVDSVAVEKVAHVIANDRGGFTVSATWKVSGAVSHFGHTHYRQNRYQAAVDLQAIEGFWKIVDIVLIDEKRIL